MCSAVQMEELTLFYAGRVKIFHDVPADKAHSIMLLLSDHCSISTSAATTAVLGGFGSCPNRKDQMGHEQLLQACDKKLHHRCGPFIRKRSQAELPFARKASFARFLEKRKHRIEEIEMNKDEQVSKMMKHS